MPGTRNQGLLFSDLKTSEGFHRHVVESHSIDGCTFVPANRHVSHRRGGAFFQKFSSSAWSMLPSLSPSKIAKNMTASLGGSHIPRRKSPLTTSLLLRLPPPSSSRAANASAALWYLQREERRSRGQAWEKGYCMCRCAVESIIMRVISHEGRRGTNGSTQTLNPKP